MVNHVLAPGGAPERSNDAEAPPDQLGHTLPHGPQDTAGPGPALAGAATAMTARQEWGNDMIGYVTLGVSDIARARAFYEALLATIGAKQLIAMEENGFTMYGTAWDKPSVVITRPYDGGAATPGNGNMVALAAESREQVDAIHARAIELGGSCEGLPGLREPASMGFYGAYFRDPDGNKLCAYKLG